MQFKLKYKYQGMFKIQVIMQNLKNTTYFGKTDPNTKNTQGHIYVQVRKVSVSKLLILAIAEFDFSHG